MELSGPGRAGFSNRESNSDGGNMTTDANTPVDPMTALRMIRDARDHAGETGEYPPPPLGPGKDQEFDDWAADLADSVIAETASA